MTTNVQFTDAYLYQDHKQDGYWQPLALEPVVPAGQNPLYEGLTIHLSQHTPGTIEGKPGQSRLGDADTLEQSAARLRRYYGARLRREGTQGLTGTSRENTLEPRATGGADLVHSRPREGTVVLVVDIRQPSKRALDEMVSLLDHVCTWYQYQQLRTITSDGRELTKRIVYREGLDTPTHHAPGMATFALTFDDVDAYWYAPIRSQVKVLDPPEKKFITAYEGDENGQGAYELPFTPVWISGSTVQDQVEVRNQSDYPLWLKYEFSGPGTDPEIRLAKLNNQTLEDQPTILVETSTDNGVIVDSTEGVQLVYREREDGSYENLFPATTSMDWFSIPARTTAHVHVSVTGATPETRVRITGYEKTTNSGLY